MNLKWIILIAIIAMLMAVYLIFSTFNRIDQEKAAETSTSEIVGELGVGQ